VCVCVCGRGVCFCMPLSHKQINEIGYIEDEKYNPTLCLFM